MCMYTILGWIWSFIMRSGYGICIVLYISLLSYDMTYIHSGTKESLEKLNWSNNDILLLRYIYILVWTYFSVALWWHWVAAEGLQISSANVRFVFPPTCHYHMPYFLSSSTTSPHRYIHVAYVYVYVLCVEWQVYSDGTGMYVKVMMFHAWTLRRIIN